MGETEKMRGRYRAAAAITALVVLGPGGAAAARAAAGPDPAGDALRLLAEGRAEAALASLRAGAHPDETIEQVRQTLEDRGAAALVSGRLGLAVRTLSTHLEWIAGAGLDDFTGRGHALYGIALQKVGRFEGALDQYEHAAAYYRQKGIVAGVIAQLINESTVQGEWLARYDVAANNLEAALALAGANPDTPREMVGVLLLNLAEARADQGRLDVGLERLAEARRVFTELDHRALLGRTAVTASKLRLSRGDAVQAEAAAAEALALAGELGDTDTLRLAHLRRGRALLALGRDEPARRELRAAVDALERLRREIGIEENQISFLRDKQETYEALIAALHRADRGEPRAGHAEAALTISEGSRGRSFLDHLPRAGATGPEPADARQIRGLLRDGEALLHYFFGRERVWVFAVTSGRLRFVDLGPAPALADRVAFVVGAARTDAATEHDLRERLVVGPLGGLDGLRSLVLVPDGPLFRLSFARLLRDDPQLAVSYAPSASVLALARGRDRPRAARPGLLAVAVGQAAARSRRAPPLPRAEREARLAGSYFAERVVLDERPTESAVRRALASARHDVLHFATHAFADPDDAGDDGLLFVAEAPGQPGDESDDGVLSAREIAVMDLDARLAVLSACTTTGSEFAPGEGMLGLSRAFLRAGVDALLVTLWDVSDEAAYRLTRRFYEEAARGQPLARALARAQHALGSRPDVWAFALVGDGGVRLPGLRRPSAWRRPLGAALVLAGAALGLVAAARRRRAARH